MRLKEITPGMVIHCPKEEDVWELLKYLKSKGYKTRGIPAFDNICLYIEENMVLLWGGDAEGEEVTEFSDLIEPDENLANKANDLANQQDSQMSAVEVLDWLIHSSTGEIKEIFGECYNRYYEVLEIYDPQTVIDKITAYEAAQKEPEKRTTEINKLMTACEKIEWLNEHSNPDLLMEIFGCKYFDTILDKFTTAEFIERIKKYEAKKAPKPAEVEEGYHCAVYDDDNNYMEYTVWGVTEETAKDDVIDKTMKLVREKEKTMFTAINFVCRVKENK